MSDIGNKDIFAQNLKEYIDASGKTRKELAEIWGFPYSTVTEWVNGRKYPRIDRVEIMADYFGINKSDLIEDKVSREAKADALRDAEILKDDQYVELYSNWKLLNEPSKNIVIDLVELLAKQIE